MLVSEMQALSAIRPGPFAWSPAFWYPYSAYSTNTVGMAGLTSNLTALLSSLRSQAGGIQLLDLQDFVAGSSCQPLHNRVTPSDAVSWTRFLVGLGLLPEVAINVELYAVDCATGAIVTGDSRELSDRRAFYVSNAVALGPAFEIRYWIQSR